MASLTHLKFALRQDCIAIPSASTNPLTDREYDIGFKLFTQDSGAETYRKFIIPQLTKLLEPLFATRVCISILEIGPGPKSVLGDLPISMRRRIGRYAAFEPNVAFAKRLDEWLDSAADGKASPLPCLDRKVDIYQKMFDLDSKTAVDFEGNPEKFDVVLFCHSMYGMEPKRSFIEHALETVAEGQGGEKGKIIVFHRDGTLHLDGLVCHQTSSWPKGAISVKDENDTLDYFARFIVGWTLLDANSNTAVHQGWRTTCRALARREESSPGFLFFDAPDMVATFTKDATSLPGLTRLVPTTLGLRIKNREARKHHAASILRPESIQQVQECVRWALQHNFSITVIGGSHSDQCVQSNVIAVDMSAFKEVQIVRADEPVVVVEAGCTSGEIIRKTMAEGVTVPLGSRPSVGTGLILQGGIGHLTRQRGLACDSFVGAVVVSVASGKILCIGNVPAQHRPVDAVQLDSSSDFLWALRGTGNNFGIVISATLKTCSAPTYVVRNWIVPLKSASEAHEKLREFDGKIAKRLPRECSADAYLYCEDNQLCLGFNTFQVCTPDAQAVAPLDATGILGPETSSMTVDAVGLFNAEMYMSAMHGGHSGGKTSSFKRCVFLSNLGNVDVASGLLAAVESRPTARCYLHFLHGGGAVRNSPEEATAFGCRDWEFACVITGVWERDQDDSEISRAAIRWVYQVVEAVLPVSSGVYGADLGPDPRDAHLATRAFGSNLPRLARLKHELDPYNVLAYACPLPKLQQKQKLLVLVTGDSCAGKDYCATIWAKLLELHGHTSRMLSISEATKREYAAATGADIKLLLEDRAYKEQHRPALTTFFQDQVKRRPQLPHEHFLGTVNAAANCDVLFITGMRDAAPVATFTYLVPESRMIEVHVQAGDTTLLARRGSPAAIVENSHATLAEMSSPTFNFQNDKNGESEARAFCEKRLLPLLDPKGQQLAELVHSTPDFPRPGVEFRDILKVAARPGGLALCTSLMRSQFAGDWQSINAIVSCEVGGLIFASPLSAQLDIPLVQVREAGKIPPPTVSVEKPISHVSSSLRSDKLEKKRIEIARDAFIAQARIVVVDDVLATGETLCAVVELLRKVGVRAEHVSILVAAEFPVHGGRELLRKRGYGAVRIQSLLVFGGE